MAEKIDNKPELAIADISIQKEAYLSCPGKSVLIYIASYVEFNSSKSMRGFVVFEGELKAHDPDFEIAKKTAFKEALENLPKTAVLSTMSITHVEWAVTIPWERKKMIQNMIDKYNDQPFMTPFDDYNQSFMTPVNNIDDDMDMG